MSAEAFLDTNILIYAAQGGDRRARIAADLVEAGGMISVQVCNEFASVARRKLGRSWAEVAAALADFRLLCSEIRPIDLACHEAALGLAESEGLSFYDALIVAAALAGGCRTLWTEDMQDGRIFGARLIVRNPFVFFGG